MNNNILIPTETHQGEVKHLYAIIAYKQQGQEKLLIANTKQGNVRCVSTERSEINRMYNEIKKAAPGNITLIIAKFSLREDQRVEFGDRVL